MSLRTDDVRPSVVQQNGGATKEMRTLQGDKLDRRAGWKDWLREIAEEKKAAVEAERRRLPRRLTDEEMMAARNARGVFCQDCATRYWRISVHSWPCPKCGSSRASRVSPEMSYAHRLVAKAIKDGELVKQPCEVCGQVRVEAHHEDYDKPLEVKWFCVKHHRRVHRSGAIGCK